MSVPKLNEFKSRIRWTGNGGTGTSAYRAYSRTWDIEIPGKAVIQCSNDPDLGGDPSLMNPEDLLLSAVAGCHMLWYLHLASDNDICVLSYRDEPVGIGETERSGAGRFLSIQLSPIIVVTEASDLEKARVLHEQVHELCFIARSLSCSVYCNPTISTE